MKCKTTGILFIFLFIFNGKGNGQEIEICWNEASSIEEALSLSESSCRLFLSINDYNSNPSSILIIDSSLSRCKNMGVLGIGTNRYLKINVDFSMFTYLEEFGIGGKIQSDVVNSSIRNCKNLQRVGIGYLDSNYVFPIFLKHIKNDNVRLLIDYHFETVNIGKLSKNIIPFLKKTSFKRIRIGTLKGLDLKNNKQEILKEKKFKKIIRVVRKKKIQLALFGIIMGYNWDAKTPEYIKE